MFDQSASLKKVVSDYYADVYAESLATGKVSSNSGSVPQVLAITGGKGGVGKTLTTANLGLCLARMGMRTLLIDGDFGLANLDVVLNLRPRYTIDDVLAGEKELSEVILTGPEGLRIIPAASGILRVGELGRVQKLALLDKIESLDEEFDFVLIDTPAGVSSNVQYWSASAAQVILVVTPEPSSLADAYATMKILSQTVHETKFKLIMNMAASQEEGQRVYGRISALAEEYLGVRVEYLGTVTLDDAVRASVRERALVVQKYPLSCAARGIREIASQIMAEPRDANAKGTVQFFWKRMVTAGHPEFCS